MARGRKAVFLHYTGHRSSFSSFDHRSDYDHERNGKHDGYRKGGEDYDDEVPRHRYASYKPKNYYQDDSSGGYGGGEEHSRWWKGHRRHQEAYSGWEESDPSYGSDYPKNDYPPSRK